MIAIAIASGRESLLKDLLPRLAREQDIKLAGEPITDAALLPVRLTQWQPELLLLDKSLLEQIGPASFRALLMKVSRVHVLLLWDDVCSGLIEQVLRNRFRGYVLTGCRPDTYVKAIRAVSQGELWLPRGLLGKAYLDLMETLSDTGATAENNVSCEGCVNPADTLTRRQRQVVQFLNQGLRGCEKIVCRGIANRS